MADNHPLVFRFGAFGDMVMITPLLKRLYTRSGKPCDIVGTGNWTRQMFAHVPWVRNVYTIKSRSTPYFISREKHKLVKQLQQHDYAFVWMLEQHKRSYQLAEKANLPVMINAVETPRLVNEHTTAQWFRLANMSPPGFDYPQDNSSEINTELFVTEDEIAECKHWLRSKNIDIDAPIVCIQAGNKKTMRAGRINRDSNSKYWHEKKWAALIDRITDHDRKTNILLCGVAAEHSMTQDIRDLCYEKARVYCVARELPLRRLFALLRIAHSCISVDTGPAHVAAAMNCNVTVLFGKADPRMYAPVSSQSRVVQCHGRVPGSVLRDTTASWAECHDISLIGPEQVYHGWLDCIGEMEQRADRAAAD